jgi:hypothetical protein
LRELGAAALDRPFVLEVKDDHFLPDGDVALVDYDDKSYKYLKAPELNLPGEKIFDWIKKRASVPENAIQAMGSQQVWGVAT